MPSSVQFDPDRLAYFEAAGWRAYYDRKWLSVLRLMLQLFGEQFHIPFPRSLLAAYYITRASLAWAPADHDEDKTLSYLKKYYRIARRYSDLPFDSDRAAELELDYWVVHRKLLGRSDTADLVETMTRLHSEIFGLPPGQTRPSAEYRVRAVVVVDRITSGQSTDNPGDWAVIEDTLHRCYRSLRQELDKGTAELTPATG